MLAARCSCCNCISWRYHRHLQVLKMTLSMTGYARLEHTASWGQLVWELKAVNHRFFEVLIRLPEPLRAIESDLRELARSAIGRGRVEASCHIDINAALRQELDTRALHQLQSQLAEIADAVPTLTMPTTLDVLRSPGILRDIVGDEAAMQQTAKSTFDGALAQLNEARHREGTALASTIRTRVAAINGHVVAFQQAAEELVQWQHARLTARLAELDFKETETADSTRVAQELALLAQRTDIMEEIDRLTQHVVEVQRALDQDEPAGRRLDFLAQELNREANTIASKAAHHALSQRAVDVKVLIEQIREQVQNIE